MDTVDGAAVRIAMTVATCGTRLGELNRVTKETDLEDTKAWAIRNGYPESLANESYVRYRFWETEQ